MILNSSRTRCAPRTFLATASTGRILSLVVLLAICFPPLPIAEASNKLQTVALSGDSTPRRPGEEDKDPVFATRIPRPFESVVINDDGQTAFIGTIETPDTIGNTPVVRRRQSILRSQTDGDLALVVSEGDSLPGSSGNDTFRFLTAEELIINNQGQVALVVLNGGFVDDAGVLKPIIDESVADSFPGKRLSSPLWLTLNDRGQMAFVSGIFEPSATQTDDFRLFLAEVDSPELKLIARSEGSSPGLEDSSISQISTPILNDQGEIAFNAVLSSEQVSAPNGSAVLRSDSGALSVVAVRGQPVPEMGDQEQFAVSEVGGGFGINNAGEIPFYASVKEPGRFAPTYVALFIDAGSDGRQLVWRQGNAVPISDSELTYGVAQTTPVLNSQGQLLFRTTLRGENVDETNEDAIVRQTPGQLAELVARRGDPAPGVEDGVLFRELALVANHSINGLGQAAFTSTLSDNTSALYAEDLSGELKLIVRTGDLLDVSDDPLMPDWREVRSFEFIGGSGNQDGRGSAFNERGQLAFSASFTDNSHGVFISNLVAIPEPTSASYVAIALTLLGMRRGRIS